MNVAIVGGGGSAHLLSVLLSERGHSVRLLSSKPDLWRRELDLLTDEGTIKGRIAKVSSNPYDIMHDAEVAFLCMPVHQYPVALRSVMSILSKNPKCIIGTVYGQGGFDWMVKATAKELGIAVPRHFAIGLLPWIVRTVVYGQSSISYGPKLVNGIATSDQATYELLQEHILDDLSFSYWGRGRFELVPNFITLTLTVDNQIIHPSRCYALTQRYESWLNDDEIPYFYRDWDDYSAEILRGIDDDYTLVRNALFSRFPTCLSKYNLDYLALEHWSYGSHNPDIKASFVNSTTLGHIKPPTVMNPTTKRFELDVNHRFFKDDFAYGLEICAWFARHLECRVPHVDALNTWFRNEIRPRQVDPLKAATPEAYGFTLEQSIC